MEEHHNAKQSDVLSLHLIHYFLIEEQLIIHYALHMKSIIAQSACSR